MFHWRSNQCPFWPSFSLQPWQRILLLARRRWILSWIRPLQRSRNSLLFWRYLHDHSWWCAHVFSPLSSTPAVQALVNGSSRVVAKPDLPDSRQEHFKALAKIVNAGGYRKFNLESSSSHNLTLNSRQISRFLGSLKSSHSSLDPQTPKPMPFSLRLQPGTEEEAPS